MAYDTDDDGFSKWQHNTDGHIHPKSSVKNEDRTTEFLKNHSWNIPRQEVEELAKVAEQKPVFLCGGANNDAQFIDLFKQVFTLSIDEETIKQRLATRRNNDWGKQQHELELTLAQAKRLEASHKEAGYTVIDATQPLNVMVDEIIEKVSR